MYNFDLVIFVILFLCWSVKGKGKVCHQEYIIKFTWENMNPSFTNVREMWWTIKKTISNEMLITINVQGTWKLGSIFLEILAYSQYQKNYN